MPSYARLFADGDPRGEALVAYLASLGAEHATARQQEVDAWTPPQRNGDPARGRPLFARLCSGCHGPEGAGDGRLASQLSLKPPSWRADGWRRVTPGNEAADLARIIRFGLPGGAMAGHEYLRETEVADLAAHVATLVRPPHEGPGR